MGVSPPQFSVSVSYSVEVKNAKLEIIEKEQNVATKTVKFVLFFCAFDTSPVILPLLIPVRSLNYPSTSQESLSADHHSMVKMAFSLVNKQGGEVMTVHQVSDEGVNIIAKVTISVWTTLGIL